ncbi:hypothetical protein [Streptomyces sp. NPDC049970]|uniref:hypothetical protein n=1 Tax=Streptomyces sp. NPDC049970 TaxID=3155033 RepID=UPI0034175A62
MLTRTTRQGPHRKVAGPACRRTRQSPYRACGLVVTPQTAQVRPDEADLTRITGA